MIDFIILALIILFILACYRYDSTSSERMEQTGYDWAMDVVGNDKGTQLIRSFLSNNSNGVDFDEGAWRAICEYEESFKQEDI